MQEKDAGEKDMHHFLKEDEKGTKDDIRHLTKATYNRRNSEKFAQENQNRVQLIEARHHSAQSTPRISDTAPQHQIQTQAQTQPQSVKTSQAVATVSQPRISAPRPNEVIPSEYTHSNPENQPFVVEDSPSRDTRWDQKSDTAAANPPLTHPKSAEPTLKQLDDVQRLKSKKKQIKLKKTSRPVSRDSSSQATSLTIFTNGEKNQFLNQMAKHAAEIVFGSKTAVGQGGPQSSSANYTASTVLGQGQVRGVLEKGGSVSQVSKGPASVQMEKMNAGEQQNKGTGVNAVKAVSSKFPLVDITTTTSTTFSIPDKPPPQIDGLHTQPGGTRPP